MSQITILDSGNGGLVDLVPAPLSDPMLATVSDATADSAVTPARAAEDDELDDKQVEVKGLTCIRGAIVAGVDEYMTDNQILPGDVGFDSIEEVGALLVKVIGPEIARQPGVGLIDVDALTTCIEHYVDLLVTLKAVIDDVAGKIRYQCVSTVGRSLIFVGVPEIVRVLRPTWQRHAEDGKGLPGVAAVELQVRQIIHQLHSTHAMPEAPALA